MTGLAILLPLVLTLAIASFLLNLLTKPFQGMINRFITTYDLHFLGSPEAVMIVSKILILIALGLFLVLFGLLGRILFVKTLFKYNDMLLDKIPIVSKIYRALRDVFNTVFHEESTSFSQVVLVHFPRSETWCIGLVTNANLPEGSDSEHMGLVSVFVPATPNPTMGFMLMYKREDLVFVDMSVEDAVRFIVSCGVMYSGFKTTSS